MAFNSLEQLPDNVKQLPTLAQQLWMSLYNSAESLEKSKPEDEAWAGVKEGWKFDETNAVWTQKSGDTMNVTIKNTTSDKGFFKTWIPFTEENGNLKIVEKEVTLKKGTEPVKRKFLQGVASNTTIDKEDERVGVGFIKKMQESAVGLNVFLEHEHTLDKTLGIITGAGGDENNFVAETMLEPEEDNENVVKVLKKAANGIRLGYSIGGRATEISKGVDTDTGKQFVELVDGDLFELSVTPMPAGEGTWVTSIAKSMNEVVKEFEAKQMESDVKKVISSELKSLITKNLNQTDFSKALEEMVQVDEIRDKMFDFWWAFRDAMHFITFNDDLSPEDKGDKIVALANEFATKIVELTSTMADLIETIDEAITN